MPPTEGVGTTLAVPLALYAIAFGLFVMFLYSQLQPRVAPNPGLAAYQPPAGTVISAIMPVRLPTSAPVVEPVLVSPAEPEASATDGRASQQPDSDVAEVKPAEVKPAPTQRAKATPRRPKAAPQAPRAATNYAAYPGYLGDRLH